MERSGEIMRAELVDPLTEAVPPAWDRFVAEQRLPVLWGSGPLTAAAWSAQSTPVLAVVSDGDTVVALLHGRFHGPRDFRRFVRPGEIPPLGVFECRLAPASLAGHRFAAGLDQAGRRAAVGAFERAVRARYRALGFCYRHVETADLPAMTGRTRRVVRVSPDSLLATEWSTVDEYVRSLSGKWRSQLRKIHSGLATRVRRAITDTVPIADAARLVNQVRSRHQRPGLVLPPISEQYLTHLNADPHTRFATYSDAAGLLALSTLHDDGTGLMMSYWGNRDRTEGGLANLYFDHYVDVVAHTIDLGRATLRPGKGMTRIKERFGARLVPNHLVVGR
ncbi:hypothetical protein [Actinokineospora enzanensis]|uniref:hypothetical protein n=1 Tax=Actinokineospora enzanensis TaxID=155975 RepID=UPI0012EB21FF|nr:hypothetical protein [Actinokineospora enzanensis]